MLFKILVRNKESEPTLFFKTAAKIQKKHSNSRQGWIFSRTFAGKFIKPQKRHERLNHTPDDSGRLSASIRSLVHNGRDGPSGVRRLQGGNHQVPAQDVYGAIDKEGIKKSGLLVMKHKDIGNTFWRSQGWTERTDLNYYSFKNVEQTEY